MCPDLITARFLWHLTAYVFLLFSLPLLRLHSGCTVLSSTRRFSTIVSTPKARENLKDHNLALSDLPCVHVSWSDHGVNEHPAGEELTITYFTWVLLFQDRLFCWASSLPKTLAPNALKSPRRCAQLWHVPRLRLAVRHI